MIPPLDRRLCNCCTAPMVYYSVFFLSRPARILNTTFDGSLHIGHILRLLSSTPRSPTDSAQVNLAGDCFPSYNSPVYVILLLSCDQGIDFASSDANLDIILFYSILIKGKLSKVNINFLSVLHRSMSVVRYFTLRYN